MRLPQHVYDTLVEVCDSYPFPVVQDAMHLGEILNAVAWRHRAEGWGLSRKTGGTRVPSPAGEIAEDILQLPDGHHFDVLGAAGVGKPLRPGQPESIGVIDLQARPWVAPVDHVPAWLAATGGPPRSHSTPQPPAAAAPACAARAVVEPLQAQIDVVRSHIDALRAQLDAVAARLDQLLARETIDPALLQATYDALCKGGTPAPSVLEHIDDVKRMVAGLPRDPRFG